MFSDITSTAETNKIATGITSAAVAGGIIFAIVKKKSFWGIFGYAIGFGLAGLAVGMVVEQFTSSN